MYIPMWMVQNSDHTSFHQDWPDPRHPADKLVDNPTAVFVFFFFFFLFYCVDEDNMGFKFFSSFGLGGRAEENV